MRGTCRLFSVQRICCKLTKQCCAHIIASENLVNLRSLRMCQPSISCSYCRKNPKNQADKDRKLRLQQRLNSLSFYDSIPLYDSIGRRTGASRSPTLISDPPSGLDNPGPHSVAHGHVLDPKRLAWTSKDPTYWGPSQEIESDLDSAIYAELDKNSRSGPSDVDTPRTTSPTRRTPNGEGPPGYALHLKHNDKDEDIYTHV